MWPIPGSSGYPKLNFISNKYPIGRAWILRYLPWKLAFLALFQSSKSQKNEEWLVISKYTILDHSWALTFGIETIFHNNYIPGHNRAKSKMSHFSWIFQQSWFLSFQQVLAQERAIFSKIFWLEWLSEGIWRVWSAFWAILKHQPNNYWGILSYCGGCGVRL